MFKFKTIPKHNFLDGSPFWKVSQREWGYVNEETGQINIPFDYVYTNENTQWTSTITTVDDFNAGITVNSPEGNIIFEANGGGVFHGHEPLTTEERVREIFREEYYNILREDIENGI